MATLQPTLTSSPFVIFLDIDGVLYKDLGKVSKKAEALFPHVGKPYTGILCDIAAAHLLDKDAVENLDFLVREMEKTRRVWIVIHSVWRKNRTIEELQKTIFVMHDFSKRIVDKTPDEIPRKEIATYCTHKEHSMPMRNSSCRTSEISYWLRQHPEITDHVVIDDYDDHFLAAFKEKFIKTDHSNLLTRENVTTYLQQNSVLSHKM